jgi:hypothetical protein
VQQTIVVETHLVPTTHPATIDRAQSYSQWPMRNTDSVQSASTSDAMPLEMSGLLNYGIYRGFRRSESLDVVPTCPTNNCKFPRFDSLAVCSSCENHTRMIEKSCSTTKTSWKPGGYGSINLHMMTLRLRRAQKQQFIRLQPQIFYTYQYSTHPLAVPTHPRKLFDVLYPGA